MFSEIIRPFVGIFVGMNFLYLINSFLFFSNVEIPTESSDYVPLIILTCFLPMMLAILLIETKLPMSKNFLYYMSYFLVGTIISQLIFSVFNDGFIEEHTKKAYNEIQLLLNISEDSAYSQQQQEFLNDKKDNNFEALSKYVKDRESIAVAGITATSNLILAMNTNKDPELQSVFDKIIEDKVITVKEIDDFNKFVIKHKMESIK